MNILVELKKSRGTTKVIKIHLVGTVHALDVEIFYWISDNFDIIVVRKQKSGILGYIVQETKNVCTKFVHIFHDSPFSACC